MELVVVILVIILLISFCMISPIITKPATGMFHADHETTIAKGTTVFISDLQYSKPYQVGLGLLAVSIATIFYKFS